MKIRLFHQIGEGGTDSAEVRRFITENGIKDLIDFGNIKYDDEMQALFELTSQRQAPVLVVDGEAIFGKEQILDWLKTNLLRMRD